MSKENMEQVSFDELWAVLKGSTKFGQDELIEMISLQDDENKDFYLYHRHKAFCVPLHKIREYFIRHTKPVPPMTKDQELKYLREKVKKLQTEAELFQAEGQLAKPAPDETEALAQTEKDEVKYAGQDPAVDDGSRVTGTVEEEKTSPVPPRRDESIPPPHERKKQSLKEIRAGLAKELKDEKGPKKKVTDSAKPQDIQGREKLVDGLLKKK